MPCVLVYCSMKLSIITINFNNAVGLKKTIESLIKQQYREFQFIIIDGGSVDSSVDIIKEYADVIDYWVSEPDTGIYQAMNKGIREANGKYLMFLNSGDYLFENTTLQKMAPILCGEDIVYGNLMF